MKVKCLNCGWRGTVSEMLSAKNPFDETEGISACPKCKTVENTCSVVCDEPECWDEATCGTPTKTGYRSTCWRHVPKREEGE